MGEVLKWLPRGVEFVGQRGTSGRDLLEGGYGHDVVYGGAGDDLLIGDGGYRDVLPAGADHVGLRDVMFGGDGRDQFWFVSEPTSVNVDVIFDFQPGKDEIFLRTSIFPFYEISPGEQLHDDQFRYGKGPKDDNDYVIYRKKTGALFIDTDGTGPEAMHKVAILANKAKIDHSDISIAEILMA